MSAIELVGRGRNYGWTFLSQVKKKKIEERFGKCSVPEKKQNKFKSRTKRLKSNSINFY